MIFWMARIRVLRFISKKSDEHWIDVWNCIIYAFAYICRKIFENQGAVYFPEPIEMADEETITILRDTFKNVQNL